jgi:hypothetical protein
MLPKVDAVDSGPHTVPMSFELFVLLATELPEPVNRILVNPEVLPLNETEMPSCEFPL